MKKILFFFSALSILMLIAGCFTENRTASVAYDYDERTWVEDHWVYRFKEQDHWIYKRWYKEKWQEEKHEGRDWERRKWEKNPMLIAKTGEGLKAKENVK